MTRTYINTESVLVYYLARGSGLEAAVNAYNISQSQEDYNHIGTLIKWSSLGAQQTVSTPLDFIETFHTVEKLGERVDELVFAPYFDDNNTL